MSLKQSLSILSIGVVAFAAVALGALSRSANTAVEKAAPQTAQKASASKLAAKMDPAGISASDEMALKALLEKRLPGIEVSDMSPSPVPGFYQVYFAGQLLYVSSNGQYVFTGNLLELAERAPINHSQVAMAEFEARKAPQRAQVIANQAESNMVVFKAADEKHVITVFTDVDCGYCRKLHKELPNLNQLGVTVRYMAYPRAGIGSDAYKKLVSVWCSDDRTAAMDDAKLRRQFKMKTCKNPIAEQYNLTQKLNLSGTPALILDDGELIGGYLPFAKLVAHLEQKAKGA